MSTPKQPKHLVVCSFDKIASYRQDFTGVIATAHQWETNNT